ncbi:MAG: cytidine deaminase [Candidatus Nanopelagicales bacterium]
MSVVGEVSEEDAKLIALARGARARVGSTEGAAVRDDTGRSYSAATVNLPSVKLTAMQLSVATAASSGATDCEGAVLVTRATVVDALDLAAIRDLGGDDVPVLLCDLRGEVIAFLRSESDT